MSDKIAHLPDTNPGHLLPRTSAPPPRIWAKALFQILSIESSVTRLGDFLHFGQPFKLPTVLGNFCKGVKIIHFSREIIFGQLL